MRDIIYAVCTIASANNIFMMKPLRNVSKRSKVDTLIKIKGNQSEIQKYRDSYQESLCILAVAHALRDRNK